MRILKYRKTEGQRLGAKRTAGGEIVEEGCGGYRHG